VFQESLLFDASIRENIRLGRLEATDSEVEAAASLVGLHEQIQGLPQGYDTMVGPRGERLSGGQRQLVAIARAVVRNPSILIVDEPTSALDAKAAMVVRMALDLAAMGRTVVAVTHHLASAQQADRILVMNGGRLVEQGTHAELLARGRVYPLLGGGGVGGLAAGEG
jgi:ABC-type multidrug transport system fused ATPase/permease subunit